MDTRRDPNRGPIVLSHDNTPQDLSRFDPNLDIGSPDPNHRYKGYAKEQFLKPKEPLTGSPDMNLPRATHQPGSDEGVAGFQYGSGQRHARPRKDSDARSPERQKQRQIADQDLARARTEKFRQQQQMEYEKKQDMELLRSYNPWGKPGAGAPRLENDGEVSTKKEKFTEYDRQQGKLKQEEYYPWGRPGAGAPLVDSTGHVTTVIPGDAEIRFKDERATKDSINNRRRYMQESDKAHDYLDELTSQIMDKSRREQGDRLDNLKGDIQHLQHNPYGRPGAGAKNPSQDYRRKLEASGPRRPVAGEWDPWGKGQGQPQRDEDGNIVRHRHTDKFMGPVTEGGPVEGASIPIGYQVGVGGGSPNRTESGHVRTRLPITMRRDEFGKASMNDASPPRHPRDHFRPYDPFGRPGAGAPLRDSEGGVVTSVLGGLEHRYESGDPRKKHMAQLALRSELQKEIYEHEGIKRQQNEYIKAPVGELATIMRRSDAGKPKTDPVTGLYLDHQPKPVSDVTRSEGPRLTSPQAKEYKESLQQAAEDRARQRQTEKLREQLEARQHHETSDSIWGKPFAGAPGASNNRQSIEKAFYSSSSFGNTPRSRGTDTGSRVSRADSQRQSITSNHRNLFDGPDLSQQPRNLNPAHYDLPAPYATVNQQQ